MVEPKYNEHKAPIWRMLNCIQLNPEILAAHTIWNISLVKAVGRQSSTLETITNKRLQWAHVKEKQMLCCRIVFEAVFVLFFFMKC